MNVCFLAADGVHDLPGRSAEDLLALLISYEVAEHAVTKTGQWRHLKIEDISRLSVRVVPSRAVTSTAHGVQRLYHWSLDPRLVLLRYDDT